MGIGPVEFLSLTPKELNDCMDGHTERLKEMDFLNARHALWVLMPHLKKDSNLSAINLLGYDPYETKEDEEEEGNVFDRLRNRAGEIW